MTSLRRINGKSYVLGLEWTQLPAGAGNAHIAAALGRGDFTHAVRLDRLVAYATVERPAFSQYSAATALNEAHSSTWLGAWDIDHGQYYVAAGGPNGIPPDGDQVFKTEAEARAHFDKLYQLGSWSALYAPEGWHVAKSDRQTLYLRIEGFTGKPVQPAMYWRLAQPVPIAIAIAMVAVIGIGGGSAWTLLKSRPQSVATAIDPPELPEPVPPPAELAATTAPTQAEGETRVPIIAAISACLGQEAMVFDARMFGWSVVGWSCDPLSLVAHMQPRKDRPVSDILSASNRRWKDNQIGGDVDIALPFVPAPASQLHGTRQTREATILQLMDVATRLSLELAVGAPSPDAPGRVQWTMNGKTPPDDLGLSLLRAGPTELISINHTFQDLTWRIMGVTYVEG